MNPRLGSARHLIVYAFMQQCDDVETIHQSVLKNLHYGNYVCETSIWISYYTYTLDLKLDLELYVELDLESHWKIHQSVLKNLNYGN